MDQVRRDHRRLHIRSSGTRIAPETVALRPPSLMTRAVPLTGSFIFFPNRAMYFYITPLRFDVAVVRTNSQTWHWRSKISAGMPSILRPELLRNTAGTNDPPTLRCGTATRSMPAMNNCAVRAGRRVIR